MSLGRREFIKAAALSAASASIATQSSSLSASSTVSLPVVEEPPKIPGVKWDKAPCRFCGTGCHVMVGVENDKVVAIAGDQKAAVNKGLLCVKGYHVGSILYGIDRLTTPLLRNQKTNELEPISWDNAIDIAAKRIMQAPERFAFYGSGQWTIPEGYAAQKFMKGGLANNHIDPNARLCMASAVTGFLSTYGVDEPASCYDDLDHADVVILWGNNPAEMHPVLFSRIVDRRSKGETVKLIDIGTRITRTSEQSDHVMLMNPHTDLAIANCIIQQLISSDRYDKEFAEKHCNFRQDSDPAGLFGAPMSFDAYVKEIKKYTPEYVEKISGVSASDLRLLGELFADPSKKIVSLWCMGMNQHTAGTAINNLVHGVHLISGHWGKPGDGPQSLTGQPSACGTVREVGTLAHALPGGRIVKKKEHREQCEKLWNLPENRINSKPGYHTVKMFEQFCTPAATGGDIDCMFVQVTNPGQSLPNTHKLFKAKSKLKEKFLIVAEVYPNATTTLADLVLPAAMWVEKNGIFGNSERRTQQWFRQVNPPGEARDDCWMTIAIAHRLMELGHPGMKDRDGNFIFRVNDDDGNEVPAWKWEHYYDINVDRALFSEYRQFTFLKHKDVAPYDELVKSRGMRWPVIKDENGNWRETRWRFVEGADKYVEKGKGFQFYHSTTKDDKAQVWWRPYADPPEMPDNEYPFWLCTGRVLEHWHTGTMTRRVKQLAQAMPHTYLEMNASDAARIGVGQGDQVIVESRRGSLKLPVWIDGRGRPPKGSVFVPFFDELNQINDVTLHAYDPFSKQPDYKKCAVRILPVNSRKEL
ncbi:molybdopterin-dependent oxidoreductase [Planctomycetota bacterium]|nr:molybdopterin-dependent oxidoreductase [Planctomycetota bacterium]